jgi:uncharacterized protein (DUF488 family)
MVSKPTIYTLGTSTRSKKEFIEVLHHFHVDTVADVRSFPQSRFEHFKKENLVRILKEEGFGYVYLGSELGGFRKGGYQAYTKSGPYLEGISLLEKPAREGITAFMCAERFPWKCHRRFIAVSLEERGWHVIHIIDKDRVWRPKGR